MFNEHKTKNVLGFPEATILRMVSSEHVKTWINLLPISHTNLHRTSLFIGSVPKRKRLSYVLLVSFLESNQLVTVRT